MKTWAFISPSLPFIIGSVGRDKTFFASPSLPIIHTELLLTMSSFFIFLKTKIILPIIIGISGLFGFPYIQKETTPPPPEPPEKIEVIDQSPKVASTTTAKIKEKTKIEVKTDATTVLKRETLAEKEKEALLDTDKVNTLVRSSVINIFCTTKSGGDFRPLSGSGIVLSKGGIVLTNAHIGQYFLLRDYRVKDFLTCVGRTGSPANPAYKLDLVYLSDDWLTENAQKINDENPTGTGENDYAFVAITGLTPGNQSSNTDNIPYLEQEMENVFAPKTTVMLAAYPAGFLGGITIQKDLWLASSVSSIAQLFYFNDPEKIDLFSIDGNIISQKGASGGAVVSLKTGKLLGIITTATDAKTTGERELAAITLPYIKSQFEKSTGKTLASFLAKAPADLVAEFDNTLRAGLTEKLLNALSR